ncbi:MAG: hypothetical protein AAF490_31315 [Chloroflexota bacterium]
MNKNRLLIVAWVVLLGLGAFQLVSPPSVLIEWETQTETNSAGFNLYRQQESRLEQTQLNSTLIASQGSSSRGAVYRFTDNSLQKGNTYLYFLEEIELDGTAVSHPTFSQTARVPHLPSWLSWPVGLVIILTVFAFVEERKEIVD